MYVPQHFAADEGTVRELLTGMGAADLVTATASGLLATFLPLIYEPTAGEHGSLLGHVARNNPQWRAEPVGEALVIVRGPDAYISPSWYASTAEHGRVVPTWNYVTAHVYGRLVVHDDTAWLDALVRRLTERHEADIVPPWSVDDAPEKYVAGQLRAIVGVELVISRIEAKAKLSQNRSDADAGARSPASRRVVTRGRPRRSVRRAGPPAARDASEAVLGRGPSPGPGLVPEPPLVQDAPSVRCGGAGDQHHAVDPSRDRERRPHQVLGRSHGRQAADPCVTDGQVWHHLVVGAPIRRVVGEVRRDHPGEMPEGLRRVRLQPQNLLLEPARTGETAVERRDHRHLLGQRRDDLVVHSMRLHERVHHRYVSRHAPGRRRVQMSTVLVHHHVGGRDGDDQGGLGGRR